jgi:hypothetical protein
MIPRDLYNDLVRLSTDERLSEAFRRACRVELGDLPGDELKRLSGEGCEVIYEPEGEG